MTDKEKIKAEVERLLNEWKLHDSSEGKYRCEAYRELLEFIGPSVTIQQKDFAEVKEERRERMVLKACELVETALKIYAQKNGVWL